MTDKKYIILVKQFLENKNLNPKRIKTYDQSKPDFEVEYINGGFFFCEVKSPKLVLDIETGCFKHSTIISKLSALLHKAVNQFNQVNKNHLIPNLIIWTSNNFQLNWHNFKEFNDGYIQLGNNEIRDFRKTDFYKKTFNAWKLIDYHIWLQLNDKNEIYEETHFLNSKTVMSASLRNLLKKNMVV